MRIFGRRGIILLVSELLRKLYSAINAFDEREIIVVGLVNIGSEQNPMDVLRIDVKERLDHPLEAVIEPEIGRTFGIVVSEDDFSPAGEMEFKPASINGKETDFKEIAQGLALARKLITQASAERNSISIDGGGSKCSTLV